MHIGIAFDQNYLAQFYALAASLFLSNKDRQISIHAIVTGVPEETRESISAYVKAHNSSIYYYDIDEEDIKKFVLTSKWTSAVYYRLLFPFLVPQDIEKFLYLDSDTLVLGDLSTLYAQETGSHPVAAVYDNYVRTQPLLGITEEGQYFNSGVLLMNMPIWRAQRISEQCFEYLVKHPERIKFVDQCALNAVLQHNWRKLEFKFNCLYSYIPDGMNAKQRKAFIRQVVVLHFTLQRPWNYLCRNPYRSLYGYYLKQSGFKSKQTYTDFQRNKIPQKMKIMLLEQYHDSGLLKKLWLTLRR